MKDIKKNKFKAIGNLNTTSPAITRQKTITKPKSQNKSVNSKSKISCNNTSVCLICDTICTTNSTSSLECSFCKHWYHSNCLQFKERDLTLHDLCNITFSCIFCSIKSIPNIACLNKIIESATDKVEKIQNPDKSENTLITTKKSTCQDKTSKVEIKSQISIVPTSKDSQNFTTESNNCSKLIFLTQNHKKSTQLESNVTSQIDLINTNPSTSGLSKLIDLQELTLDTERNIEAYQNQTLPFDDSINTANQHNDNISNEELSENIDFTSSSSINNKPGNKHSPVITLGSEQTKIINQLPVSQDNINTLTNTIIKLSSNINSHENRKNKGFTQHTLDKGQHSGKSDSQQTFPTYDSINNFVIVIDNIKNAWSFKNSQNIKREFNKYFPNTEIKLAYSLRAGGIAIHLKSQEDYIIVRDYTWPPEAFNNSGNSINCHPTNQNPKVILRNVDPTISTSDIQNIIGNSTASKSKVTRFFYKDTGKPMPIVKVICESADAYNLIKNSKLKISSKEIIVEDFKTISSTDITCFNCKEKGHIARICKNTHNQDIQ